MEYQAGIFDKLTAGGFDTLTGGTFDGLSAGALKAAIRKSEVRT